MLQKRIRYKNVNNPESFHAGTEDMSSGASNRSKTTIATDTDYALVSTATSSLIGGQGNNSSTKLSQAKSTASPPASSTSQTTSRDTTRCDTETGQTTATESRTTGATRDSSSPSVSQKISINIDMEKQKITRRKKQDKT